MSTTIADTSSTRLPTPKGLGSVSEAPQLPAGFAEQAPDEIVAALTQFLAPYREAAAQTATSGSTVR